MPLMYTLVGRCAIPVAGAVQRKGVLGCLLLAIAACATFLVARGADRLDGIRRRGGVV
jgi:hypothetical protein